MVLSPHGNARYCSDGNRPLWCILLRYSATTVMYGIFYILYFIFYIFLCFSRVRVVLRCQFVPEHENHHTSNLNMKYSGDHNKRQCPDHRQTFAANRQRSQARATPPDVNCFITRPKPLKKLPPPYRLRFRTVKYYCQMDTSPQQFLQNGGSTHPYCTPQNYRFIGSRQVPCSPLPPPLAQLSLCTELSLLCWLRWRRGEP